MSLLEFGESIFDGVESSCRNGTDTLFHIKIFYPAFIYLTDRCVHDMCGANFGGEGEHSPRSEWTWRPSNRSWIRLLLPVLCQRTGCGGEARWVWRVLWDAGTIFIVLYDSYHLSFASLLHFLSSFSMASLRNLMKWNLERRRRRNPRRTCSAFRLSSVALDFNWTRLPHHCFFLFYVCSDTVHAVAALSAL